MPIHKKVNKNFFKKWTSDMAYVLGFFVADGYITVNKRGGQFWSIQITDKDLLEDIKKTVNSDHKISNLTQKQKGKIFRRFRLQIGSKEMCNDLRKLGMREKKTKSLVVPNVPKKYFSSFVRGYFDGDGNVWVGYIHKNRKNPSIALMAAFTSCSFGFLNSLLDRLRSYGIQGGSLFEPKPSCYRLQLSTKDALKLSKMMYNTPHNLFLERKKVVFANFAKMQS